LFTGLSSKKTGIEFKNTVRESEEFNILTYGYFYQGGGVAVGDVNNDGLPDIYFTGNMMASKLYLNKGDWKFEDISEQAGVSAAGLWNTGTAMADVNGDGLQDIYVCRSAANDPNNRKNLLFINNGDLTFTEQAEKSGLADPGYSTQATFFDYDQDGDLDMYLLNHSIQEYAGFSRITGKHKNRKDKNFGDKLFRNDGGLFTDVSESAGIISNVLGFGLAVTLTDTNNDGWLDIYISNDYSEEDYFYVNQRDGTFKESLREHFGHVSLFSMGADGADINNDLHSDIITADMLPESNYFQKRMLGPENYQKYGELMSEGFFPQTMRNMLQLNQGNGYFSEVGQLAGISNTDWSWAVLAADYDNDGWKDILITNGYMRNYLDMDFLSYLVNEKIKSQSLGKEAALLEMIEKMPPIKIQNYLYKNNGDLSFSNKSTEWGIDGMSVSNAAAYADFDNDGDLDLIICHTNAEASVYRNNSESLNNNNFLKVKFKGNDKNTFGIGAKVVLYAKDKHFHQEMVPVRGLQSSVNHELVFGLGDFSTVDSLLVYWPDGKRQTLTEVKANQAITLQQSAAQKVGRPISKPEKQFEEIRDKLGLNYKHEEANYLDFKQDRLMPNAISTAGPKILKGDINKDGLEDFYIGGSKGASGKLYRQSANGKFVEVAQKAFEDDKEYQDMDGIFFDADGDGFLDLYVVSGGSAFPENSPLFQDRLYRNDGKGNFTRSLDGVPEMFVSGSSVTAGDFDKDGLDDLFVGGRFIPGKYPVAPRSFLLKNKGKGKFEDVTADFCPELMDPGLVTDVQFIEMNGDGWLDLVVVGEWMEIGVYTNERGEKYSRKKDAFPRNTSGWWLTIAADDFDQDGDVDLVLGNFGLNNPYKPDTTRPASLVFKDFDNNGSIDPIFSYYMADTNSFAYSRDELIGQIPSMKKKFPDYLSFAKADITDFFSAEQMVEVDSLGATLLESIYLENNGQGNFSIKKLPVEAQFSPIYAIASMDVNHDGHADLVTGGNLETTRVSSGQYDANYGMVFLGDGKGVFTTLNPAISGLNIRGDIRDISRINIKATEYGIFSRNDDSLKIFKIWKDMDTKEEDLNLANN
jgi:hypothetical protein